MPEEQKAFRGSVTTAILDEHTRLQHRRDWTITATTTDSVTYGTHQRPIADQTVRNRLREHGLRERGQYMGQVLTPHTPRVTRQLLANNNIEVME